MYALSAFSTLSRDLFYVSMLSNVIVGCLTKREIEGILAALRHMPLKNLSTRSNSWASFWSDFLSSAEVKMFSR
jgi:hypothetical protein